MNDFQTVASGSSHKKELSPVIKEVQEFISSRYSALLFQDQSEQTEKQIKSTVQKYLLDRHISVAGFTTDELVERLYNEMAEFSFITPYLSRADVEEVNINNYKDVKVTYSDGRILPTPEHFISPEHAADVVRRMLNKSGMILDYSRPMVVGHLANNIRITVFGNPLTDNDKGLSASIRIVNPQKLAKADFIANGTATEEMLDFLSLCLRYGVSICITGSTSSGKTTLMGWILSEIPNDLRAITIEHGCREFDLVKEDESGNVINNVVHLCTHVSDNPAQTIDQERLLEGALTFNPNIIGVGEMKSSEAFAAQEAARTGHAVITTTHANSCEATYARMETLCKQKYDLDDSTLYRLVTEAFPIVAFVKKLEDNSRKIMEITECQIKHGGERFLRTLYRYNVRENQANGEGKIKVVGDFEKAGEMSETLKMRFIENGVPACTLQHFTNGGKFK